MDHHELETQRLEMELADWLSEKDQNVQAAAESSDDALEDSDDVQNVFTNMDLTPDVLAALDAEDG